MRKLSDYNNQMLCKCFNCFNMKQYEGKDITQVNIELKDNIEDFTVVLEKGKFLSFYGVRFAKVDENGTIHIFKDFIGK